VVGLVDRVRGPREPDEAMLLPFEVVFVQAEEQCVLEVLGNCRRASYLYAERELPDSRDTIQGVHDVK
jgi:hypothetical protein